ncbi:unnamed protein product [Tetraodon nigroviridis]|uniref:Chromosome undetermined SCAF9003, whole genome shotgun sequence n=1 Tax=Tetraodon nigroviridis TaxID=99883 RepID=Q4T610_TETNG|nr:unnamed protein product [Tetraodon nigroviridis]
MRKPEAFEQEGQASVWRRALPAPYSALIFLLCMSKDEHTLSPVNKLTNPTQPHLVKPGFPLSPTNVCW